MNEGLRTLIVEDNPADVDLVLEALPATGPMRIVSESVPRVSDALVRLAKGGIDLVLTDLGLPDSQGLETYRLLRHMAPDLPIIVLTGNDDQELAVAAVREGAQEFLIKGHITGDLLIRAVRYAIERKRVEMELQKASDQIKTLRGIVPICAKCKKIRDDQGYWEQVEVYVRDHTEAQFTHGICPECMEQCYPEFKSSDQITFNLGGEGTVPKE
jgi:CheY-like chemotaxis protein